MFYIYKHTTPSGRCYIGQTVNPKKRWKPLEYKECQKFFYAIIMYGWNNITHEIIDSCETQEKANELEAFYIKKYDSVNNGYNILTGGITHDGMNNPFCGRKHTEESKKKMSQNHKRREITPEERQVISERTKGENNPMYGISVLSLMSDEKIAEWKKHLSEANGGGNNPAAKPVIIIDTLTNEEIYCEYRKQVKEKTGLSGCKVPEYLREQKLYKGRYLFKEVV